MIGSPLAGTLGPLGVGRRARITGLVFLDDFIDTNGTSLDAHTPSPTNLIGSSWTINLGAALIQSNWVELNASIVTMAANDGEVDAEASIRPSTTTPTDVRGVIVRYTSTANYWSARLTGGNLFSLVERNTSVETVRASTAFAYSVGTFYTIRVIAQGTLITATIDGGNSISYPSATFNQTATRHGLRGRFSTDRAEYFKLTII